MFKHFILTLVLFSVSWTLAFSQSRGEIKGTLVSSDNDEALAFATVTAYTAVDTQMLDYVLTEDDGSFRIRRLPLDKELRVVISFLGFEPIREEFTLTSSEAVKDFGKLEMISSSQTLEEILVQAERPPITMNKDTIEFNAAAFTTRDGATVEDLVKKLPGVVVDNQGNITANGRAVTKVRVDGKDFFGGDPRVALRNLTSDMISKIQITDDREEDPQRLLADDEVDQVINLRLKKDAKLKAFGKVYAGGGTEDRFEMGGIVNSFQDTFQLSAVGYYNNLTKTNLSMDEVLSLGGFQTRRSGYWGGSQVDGIQFGAGGAGYPLSLLGGANANATFGGAKFSLQYFYSHNELEFGSETLKEQTIRPDSTFYYSSQNEGNSSNDGHNVTGGLRWEIDTATQLNINLSFNASKGIQPSVNDETSAFNRPDNLLQEFTTTEDPRSDNSGANARVYFNKKLNNAGRNISFRSSFSQSRNNNDLLSNFERTYFLNEIDSVVYFDQLRTQFRNNRDFNISLNYTEPIFKNWFIDVSGRYRPSSSSNNIETSQMYPIDTDWNIIGDLTNDYERDSREVQWGSGIRYRKDKVQINLSADYDHLKYSNYFGVEIPEFKEEYKFISPRLQIMLDGWRINYRYNYSTPDIDQLHPVTDNTNPLYVREGNPDLQPVRSHSMWVSKFSFQRKWKYRVFLNGSYRDESIISTSRVDGSGVTYSKPINFVGDAYNVRGGGGLGRTFEMENQKISIDLDLNTGLGSGPFFINGQEGISNNYSVGGSLTVNYNLHDVLDFAPRYSINNTKNTYLKVDYRDVDVVNHNLSSALTVYLPWDIEFQNDITYSYIPQVTPGFRKSSVLWHAALNKKLLRSKKLTLRLSAFDILDQNINFYRYVNFNTITDGQHRTLSRYVTASLIYDFRGSGGSQSGNTRPGPPRGRMH